MCTRWFPALVLALTVSVTWAWATQSYVPPPPPQTPQVQSKSVIHLGKSLFEENVLVDGRLEIYNYLGRRSCASCHDKKKKLKPKRLAKKFGQLRDTINQEITQRCQGTPLPLQDPAMEALVQYLIDRYNLHDYKLSE